MAEIDYSGRRATGVVVSLERLSGWSVRVVFDDVEKGHFVDAAGWLTVSPYTSTEYDGAKFAELTFTDAELAEIGFNLLARLSALAKSDA